MSDHAVVHWYKSSRSAGNGACVEVAVLSSGMAVRDSKDPGGPVLTFEAGSWRAFITAIQSGALDGATTR